MTISTVVKLNEEERKTLRTAVDILHEIYNNSYVSSQCSDVYYSGGFYDHLDFDELSSMEQMLDDLATADYLELEP